MGQDGEDGEGDDPGVTIEVAQLPPRVFRREIRDALRYEKGLVTKALLVIALVAVIVILRTLHVA